MNHDRQRLLELAGAGREIADELVGLFAHHTALLEVREDAVQQVGIGEQLHGRRLLGLRKRRRRLLLGLQGLGDLLILERLEFQKHLAQVSLDNVFIN